MPDCDLIIGGARVIDGSGGASTIADVVVDGDRIVDVGGEGWRAQAHIDASGLVLAPGFIDSHTHDDLAAVQTPDLEFKLTQGVTTVIAGNCGISLAPLQVGDFLPPPFPLLGAIGEFRYPTVESYAETLHARPCAANLALLAGHSSLRLGAMDDRLDRAADAAEIESMRQSLRLALRQGCIGMSTGLTYPPAAAASTDEIVQLAQVLHEFDRAVYATHMRDEGDRVLEAVDETLEIGSRAEVPVVISHHKCAGRQNFGRSRQTLAKIDAANRGRLQVGFDVYPYTASSTSLLPEFVRRPEAVLIAESEPHPEFNGLRLDRVMASLDCSLEEACERLYPAAAIYFEMSDEDLERIMSHPGAMIGSDGIASMHTPHPRLWGTFARVLGHYVREKKLFDLETAVHKMTGLPAQRFGLEGRGRIAPGHYADLVLFDAAEIIDRASFDNPLRASAGIHGVWVNGRAAWRDGAVTGRHGRFLRH